MVDVVLYNVINHFEIKLKHFLSQSVFLRT